MFCVYYSNAEIMGKISSRIHGLIREQMIEFHATMLWIDISSLLFNPFLLCRCECECHIFLTHTLEECARIWGKKMIMLFYTFIFHSILNILSYIRMDTHSHSHGHTNTHIHSNVNKCNAYFILSDSQSL